MTTTNKIPTRKSRPVFWETIIASIQTIEQYIVPKEEWKKSSDLYDMSFDQLVEYHKQLSEWLYVKN